MSYIRLIFPLVLSAIMVLSLSALAQSPADARDVIRQQLDAFSSDDPEVAFGFASDGIQDRFESPERFLDMVRSRYPALYEPRHIAFAETLEISGERVHQRLLVVDQSGRSWTAIYSVVYVQNKWRIEGVSLRETPQSAV